jgi:hypothetical protein
VFGGIFGCDLCSSEFLTPYQVDINFISGLSELIQNYFMTQGNHLLLIFGILVFIRNSFLDFSFRNLNGSAKQTFANDIYRYTSNHISAYIIIDKVTTQKDRSEN